MIMIRELSPAIQQVREALEFYASPGDYLSPFTGGMGKLYFDCGSIAHEALAALQSLMQGGEPQASEIALGTKFMAEVMDVISEVIDPDYRNYPLVKRLSEKLMPYLRTTEPVKVSLDGCIKAMGKIDSDDVGSALPDDDYRPYAKVILNHLIKQGVGVSYD